MDRAQKEKVVEELGQIFESSGVVVVAHYAGLTVAEMQDLRARASEAGGAVRVAKNRLVHDFTVDTTFGDHTVPFFHVTHENLLFL